MADALRALAIGQFPVQFDSLSPGKFLLLQPELRRQVQQPHLLLFFRNYLVEKSKMIAEKTNAGGVVHRNIFSDILLVKNRCHRSDIFVTEPQIDASETGIAWLDRCDAYLAIGRNHVPGKNLLCERHSSSGVGVRDRWQEDLPLHPSHIE